MEEGEGRMALASAHGTHIERILKRVRRARWDRHVVADLGVNVGAVFGVEAERALGYEEGLVVLGGVNYTLEG